MKISAKIKGYIPAIIGLLTIAILVAIPTGYIYGCVQDSWCYYA